MELLIHVGVDMVAMQGDGFTCFVQEGQQVKAGDKLIAFDRQKIKQAGHPDCMVVLVTYSHMDHWFPTDLIHRHEHFGHGAAGTLEVYGNQAVRDAFDAHILIDRFKTHPIDGVVNFHVTHGGDHIQINGWDIVAVPADHDKREESLVYICKKDGKTVFYGHDTGIQTYG